MTQSPSPTPGYEFTSDWFTHVEPTWRELTRDVKPRVILEIGSFEGRSACWMIDTLPGLAGAGIDLVCIDRWAHGPGRQPDPGAPVEGNPVEERFDRNVSRAVKKASHPVTVRKIKGPSIMGLAKLLLDGRSGSFDMVYVDGGHGAPDVLADAVLAFRLLRVGGLMIFDDYLWANDRVRPDDILRTPKPAIDAFLNVHWHAMRIVSGKPVYQLYATKRAE
ncbi:MAG: class I SAM-dependent methyltransferase [Planctomycetia bacterium]